MPFLVSIGYFRIPHNTLSLLPRPPQILHKLSSSNARSMETAVLPVASHTGVLRGSSRVPAPLTLVGQERVTT